MCSRCKVLVAGCAGGRQPRGVLRPQQPLHGRLRGTKRVLDHVPSVRAVAALDGAVRACGRERVEPLAGRNGQSGGAATPGKSVLVNGKNLPSLTWDGGGAAGPLLDTAGCSNACTKVYACAAFSTFSSGTCRLYGVSLGLSTPGLETPGNWLFSRPAGEIGTSIVDSVAPNSGDSQMLRQKKRLHRPRRLQRCHRLRPQTLTRYQPRAGPLEPASIQCNGGQSAKGTNSPSQL